MFPDPCAVVLESFQKVSFAKKCSVFSNPCACRTDKYGRVRSFQNFQNFRISQWSFEGAPERLRRRSGPINTNISEFIYRTLGIFVIFGVFGGPGAPRPPNSPTLQARREIFRFFRVSRSPRPIFPPSGSPGAPRGFPRGSQGRPKSEPRGAEEVPRVPQGLPRSSWGEVLEPTFEGPLKKHDFLA